MMSLRPLGPRTRSTRPGAPALSLSLSSSSSSLATNTPDPLATTTQSQSNPQAQAQGYPAHHAYYGQPTSTSTSQSTFTALSPSDTPRFNGPIPTLVTPVPSRGRRGPPRINVHIGSVNVSAPHLANPSIARATDSTSGSNARSTRDSTAETQRPEERTIRPQETYSPDRQYHHPTLLTDSGGAPQIQPLPVMDPVMGIREAIERIAITNSYDDDNFPSVAGSSSVSRPMSTSPSASPSYTGATIASESSSGESSPAHGASTSNEASNHSSSQSSSNGANAKGSSNNVNNHNTSRSNTPPSAPLQPVPKKEFTDELLTIVSRLGEGAGGAVHRVLDMRDGMTYARKTITTRDSTSVRQVVRELSIISGTRHRNIVLCYGAYMSPSSSEVKIVMEYCDGKSLEAVGAKLREVKAVIGEKIAGRIAEGVLQGLAYLHTKKTIHRDIKPSNILLSREGIVKLCDFGVSGELVNSIVGTFTGTLIYMAPERVSGQEYTVRSDVWSTGISLLELVQNRFPFPSNLPTIELILMITTGEPPKLEDEPEAGVTWSDEMKDFIGQTLIRDAALRPTPEQMLVHPWIVNTMKQDVHMARWIRQVWGWAKARKGRRSDTTDSIAAVGGADAEDSRPSTAGGGSRERQRRDSESPLEG